MENNFVAIDMLVCFSSPVLGCAAQPTLAEVSAIITPVPVVVVKSPTAGIREIGVALGASRVKVSIGNDRQDGSDGRSHSDAL